jgi:hypothetical protein
VPNLVNTVTLRAHEQETLQVVVEARAKVSQMTVSDIICDRRQGLRSESGGAVEREPVTVVERYPISRTRISYAAARGHRNRTRRAARLHSGQQRYNTEIRTFPGESGTRCTAICRCARRSRRERRREALKVEF